MAVDPVPGALINRPPMRTMPIDPFIMKAEARESEMGYGQKINHFHHGPQGIAYGLTLIESTMTDGPSDCDLHPFQLGLSQNETQNVQIKLGSKTRVFETRSVFPAVGIADSDVLELGELADIH